jgi:hypothetical protein
MSTRGSSICKSRGGKSSFGIYTLHGVRGFLGSIRELSAFKPLFCHIICSSLRIRSTWEGGGRRPLYISGVIFRKTAIIRHVIFLFASTIRPHPGLRSAGRILQTCYFFIIILNTPYRLQLYVRAFVDLKNGFEKAASQPKTKFKPPIESCCLILLCFERVV